MSLLEVLLSGPLLDRIDIHIEVDQIPYDQLKQKQKVQTSEEIRNRVNQARKIQILKVARTIADLEASKEIQEKHVTEAIQYRSLDRKYWHNMS